MAYIYHGADPAKRICQECVLCTLREAKRCEQLIGKISPEWLFPSPPFSSVTADVAGPYIVQDRTSSMKISKVCVLVYLCDNSKALHTEVVENYSGAALITALRQAFVMRNMPAQISTDPGRNFVKAKSLFSSDYVDAKLKSSITNEICAAFPHVI